MKKLCAFVISTHDVMVPLDNSRSRTLLLRSCTCVDSSMTAWDAHLVPCFEQIEAGRACAFDADGGLLLDARRLLAV
jgi:hypothetical protein